MGAAEGRDRAISEKVMPAQHRPAAPSSHRYVRAPVAGATMKQQRPSTMSRLTTTLGPAVGAAIDRWSSVPPWAGPSARYVDLRSVGPHRVAEQPRPALLDVPTPRPRGCVRVLSPVAGSARHSGGGVLGSTRPAPIERSPYGAAAASCPHLDNEGIIPVLARAVREIETAVQRGPVASSVRTKFQVVALLVRDERAQVKADTPAPRPTGPSRLKRLDGVATILAKKRRARHLPPRPARGDAPSRTPPRRSSRRC